MSCRMLEKQIYYLWNSRQSCNIYMNNERASMDEIMKISGDQRVLNFNFRDSVFKNTGSVDSNFFNLNFSDDEQCVAKKYLFNWYKQIKISK